MSCNLPYLSEAAGIVECPAQFGRQVLKRCSVFILLSPVEPVRRSRSVAPGREMDVSAFRYLRLLKLDAYL